MINVFLLAVSVWADPVFFVHPSDIHEARGVVLEPQLPTTSAVLVAPDGGGTGLWYAPTATRPVDEGVEIYYQRVEKSAATYEDQRALCVGVLRKDGSFTMPALQLEAPGWGGANNVVMRRSKHKPTWGGFNVFQMARHDDAWWLLYWDQPAENGEAGAMLAKSEDGYTWEKLPGAVFTEHNDAYTLLEKDGRFLLYQTMLEVWPDKPFDDNLPKLKRVQSIRESADLKMWTPQRPLLRPDELDPPTTEFYLLKVFSYGGAYLGLMMKYFADPSVPGKHSALLQHELLVSTNALEWVRPWREKDMGFWSYADPFIHGDELKFVIWKDNGMNTVGYRPNRLVAAVTANEGEFSTAPRTAAGQQPLLDFEAPEGWVEISVTDDEGNSLDANGSVKLENQSSEAAPVQFAAPLPDEPVRFRIRMQRAKIYAITFQPGKGAE